MTWTPIDQDQSQDDESCGVQLAVDVLTNLNDSADERHSGASRHWTAQAAYSTPSATWRSIPLKMPSYAQAGTLKCALRYEAAVGGGTTGDDCVDVRLCVNGEAGSTTRLTQTASVQVVELSVSLADPTRTVAHAAIQVRSVRGDAFATSVTVRVDEQVSAGVAQATLLTGTLSAGRTHYEYVLDTDEGIAPDEYMGDAYHVTRAIDQGASVYWLQHWPHVAEGSTLEQVEGSVNATGTIYPLGTLTPHGVAVWWESSGNSFAGVDTWLSQHGPMMRVRPYTVQFLTACASAILKRPYIWQLGPRGDEGATASLNGGQRIGYTALTSGSAASRRIYRTIVDYDSDAQGVVVAGIVGCIGSALAYDSTLTLTWYDDAGSSLGTETWTQRCGPVPGVGVVVPQTYDGQPGSSYALYSTLARDPYEHGSGDLMGAEEYRPGSVIGDVSSAASHYERRVSWPSGPSDGDVIYLEVVTDTSSHHWCAGVWEWR